MFHPTASCFAQTVRRGPSGPVTDPNVTAVNAEGWSVQYTSPPTFDPVNSPKYVVASRAGYDAAATATTYTDNLIITQRVRQAYPSQASLDANRCALTDYVYSTDTVAGVTNNSAETSPLPIANWVMPHRLTVGNTISLEVVAFHRDARNGKQVACVKFIATDGTTTVSQVVSTPTVSARGGDTNPVIVYACALDVSTLIDPHLITVNAEVYPWIGGTASVAKSATTSVVSGSLERAFSPRYFYRNTGILAAPYYAYVKSTGNDSTGVASLTEATAKASPCLTWLGAVAKLKAQRTALDNVQIKISDTVSVGTTFLGDLTQNCGAIVTTRDPAVAKSAAILTLDQTWEPQITLGIISPLTTGAIYFTDLTFKRSGVKQIKGETANHLELIFDNVAFDSNSVAGTYMNATCVSYFYGTAFSNVTDNLEPATPEIRCFRGCSATLATHYIDGFLTVGNSWTTIRKVDEFGSGSTPPTRTASGTIIAFNKFLSPAGTDNVLDIGATEDLTGVAVVQNLFEICYTSATFALRCSGDSTALGNVTHLVMHHNTFTGFADGGRWNMLYDVTATGPHHRTHKLSSHKGNIADQINTKGDVFITDGTFIGNWAYLYGVGCQGEWSQFIDAGHGGIGTSFAQAYPGMGSNLGTSFTVRNDPLWTNYQGTTSGPTLGAGGGDYTLQNTSPCKALVTNPVLAYDLAGVARGTIVDSTGAYYHA